MDMGVFIDLESLTIVLLWWLPLAAGIANVFETFILCHGFLYSLASVKRRFYYINSSSYRFCLFASS